MNIQFVTYILFLVLGFSMAQQNKGKKATLTVTIDGLQNNTGKVRIALDNSEEGFSSHGEISFRGGDAQIKNRQASYIFNDIPYGTYAVKVFHDENNNDELDSNFMLIPQEPYGFSNNARGTFGPASWDDACFEIKTDSLDISVTVE